MAKKNFSFEKRRRELDKKNKKEARKLLKEEIKARGEPGAQDAGEPSSAAEDGAPGLATPTLDPS